MQVDAHVRFVKDWDVDIVNQWKSARNEMAVLSTYMQDLNGAIDPETHESKKPSPSIMCNTDYEAAGYLKHGMPPRPIENVSEPILHPFWAAGFSFGRGHFVVQVPYDQYLPMVFQGEEASIGIRGFTYGYDYYAPEGSICFHMYALHKTLKTEWLFRSSGKINIHMTKDLSRNP
jgi:[Skp1-protein]-hydroxyproline N-acetylglucosaminyltransferase